MSQLTPEELTELHACLDAVAKVGEGLSNALAGIAVLLRVGAHAVERSQELAKKLDNAPQGSA